MFSFFFFIVIAALLLVVSVVGIVLRIFFPGLFLGRRYFGSFGESARRETGRKNKKEGEVSIDYVPPRRDFRNAQPSQNVSSDQYVDYEEIKDDTEDQNQKP